MLRLSSFNSGDVDTGWLIVGKVQASQTWNAWTHSAEARHPVLGPCAGNNSKVAQFILHVPHVEALTHVSEMLDVVV